MGSDEGRSRTASVALSTLSVALIIAGVLAALAATQRLTFSVFGAHDANILAISQTIPTDTVAGLLQPQSATFSPDGQRIAVVGSFGPCLFWSSGRPQCGHGLAIFDARSGDLLQVSPIEPLLGVSNPNPAGSANTSNYVALKPIGWAPDSTWYATLYAIFSTPAPTSPDDLVNSGLLLINPQTGATQLIRGDSGYFAALAGQTSQSTVWDLALGVETPTSPVAPAWSYGWKRGALNAALPLTTAQSELPTTAGPRYPVGQPDGSAPFTIWQPGIVFGPASYPLLYGRSAFVTTFSAWSPSGTYVTTVTTGLSLPTPAKAMSPVSALTGEPAPSTIAPGKLLPSPARDFALARVQESVGENGWAQIAWSPSGDTLASVVCFARDGLRLEARDTTSGALIGSDALSLKQQDPGCRDLGSPHDPMSAPNLGLSWSPDGSEIALVDRASSTLTLWRVTTVGRTPSAQAA